MCILAANGGRGSRVKRKRAPADAGALGNRRDLRLRVNADDDAAALRAAATRVVRSDRLLLAVADHVDLLERHLVLLVEVPLHGFGALHSKRLVERLAADVVRVTLDLDQDALRVALRLRDALVQPRLGLIRKIGLAELEVA